MNFNNLDTVSAYKKLLTLAPEGKNFDFRRILDGKRVESCKTMMAGGLQYSWAAKPVNDGVLELFQALADETELIAKYNMILNGETMNPGENRKVLHHLLRGQSGNPVMHDGKDLGKFYAGELARFSAFADKVHRGELKGSTGKQFTTVVQIGIGGSDLANTPMTSGD